MKNKDKVIREFGLKSFGTKGWYSSKRVTCPKCGRSDKFGIKFNARGGGSVHCFYDEYKDSLYKYLKGLGKEKLLTFSKDPELEIIQQSISEDMLNTSYIEQTDTIQEITMPIGYKSLEKDDKYLKSRYFTDYHYSIFKPGRVRLHPKLDKTYIVFLLYQEFKLVGWLARSRNDKHWHDKNLKDSKEGLCELKLRYYNSSEIEFSHILGGYDEITENTEIVILVEGLFDKVAIDQKLGLLDSEVIKCVCTWGNKVSSKQAKLLKKKTLIQSTYLMYDFATIEESKKASLTLYENGIRKINVCEITQKDFDPGDLTEQQLDKILANAENFQYFYVNKIAINLK